MKKTLSLVLVGLMGFMVLPGIVGAETIKVGDKIHSVIEVEPVEECSNIGPTYLAAINDGKTYYTDYESPEDLVYVGLPDGTCREATVQEYIEFWNFNHYDVEYGEPEDIFNISFIRYYNYFLGYSVPVPTTDTEVVEGKTYYDDTAIIVENPVAEDLDELLELYFYVRPLEYKIDPDIEYYVKDPDSDSFELVSDPTLENLKNYYYLQSEYDYGRLNKLEYSIEQADLDTFYTEYAESNELDIETTFPVRANLIYGKVYLYHFLLINTEDGIEELSFWTDLNLNPITVLNDKKYYELSEFTNNIIWAIRYSEESESEELVLLDKDLNYITTLGILDDSSVLNDYDSQQPYMGLISSMYSIDGELEYIYHLVYTHELLDGKDQTYSDEDLLFRFSGLLSRVEKVLVNGEEVAEENVTLTSGSTIVTLKKAYLDTLAKGTYTLEVEYEDGAKPSTTFKVNEKPAPAPTPTTDTTPNPDTVDNTSTYLFLGLVSCLGLLGTGLYIKKRYN